MFVLLVYLLFNTGSGLEVHTVRTSFETAQECGRHGENLKKMIENSVNASVLSIRCFRSDVPSI